MDQYERRGTVINDGFFRCAAADGDADVRMPSPNLAPGALNMVSNPLLEGIVAVSLA